MKRRTEKSVGCMAAILIGLAAHSANAQPKFYHMHGGEINGIFFLGDGLRGWTAEDGTRVRRTLDGGVTWQYCLVDTDNLETRVPLLNVFFFDQSNGWAVGTEGVVFKSTDGGANWSDANPTDRI